MGYRSDVAYTIRFEDDHDKKAEQTFYTFLAEAKSKPECAQAMTEVKIDEKKRQINFYDYNTKWYESNSDVQSHMKLWAMAEEYSEQDDSCIGGLYLEIGEDENDNTSKYFGKFDHDWLHMERKIIMDWEPENT
jgi:hypothetical protein